MPKIAFVDMKRMHDPVRQELHQAALRVIDSGRYIGGEEVKRFEQEMASWMGVPEVCGVSCATSGIYSVLKCMGIGPGDEVITTVHTAIATAEAVSMTGAKVVFCDLKPGYFFLDSDDVERKITARTKALLPVHLYGQPAELDRLVALARKHNLRLVEDCAQAQGARYGGKFAGTFGDAAVFSFFPSKNLGGFGDGGAVTARDPALMKRLRMFCNHGRESKYSHEFEGVNSRLDTLQAALLRVLLPRLDEGNRSRRAAARWYAEELSGIPQVTIPAELPGTEPIYHVYVILVPDRDALQQALEKRGIETGIHYPYSLNVLPAYAHFRQGKGSFPRAEDACRHMLSLPMHPALTREEVREIGAAIRQFYGV